MSMHLIKKHILSALSLVFIMLILSCGGQNTHVRDRNNEEDGNDLNQPRQSQDSVDSVINAHQGTALDTLPNSLR